MDEWGRPNTVEEFNSIVARIAVAEDPYDPAVDAWCCAMNMLASGYPDAGPYLLWACFTDWVELEPEEEAAASRAMRTAAAEWPKVSGDEEARVRYFDHWMYDVMDVQHALPDGWTWSWEEASAGVYVVTLRHRDGRSLQSTGTDRGSLMHELSRHAYASSGEFDPLAAPDEDAS